MYIEPNGTIIPLHNVPLNPNSEDTLLFDSQTAQYNYFYAKKLPITLNEQTYSRYDKGILRVEGKADDYYTCNYIMFRNRNHGTRWFYAYVTEIEYVNDGMTRLHFTLDVVQTYLFNYTAAPCFIERTTTSTDGIGDWLAPETVALGEYKTNSFKYLGGNFANKRIIVMYVDPDRPNGRVYDSIYSAAALYAYDPLDDDDIGSLNSFIASHTHDSIIGMYMIPAAFVHSAHHGELVVGYDDLYQINDTDTAIASGQALDGYVPKNNKLYTYPYSYYRISNGVGNEIALRYEFFTARTPQVNIAGNTLPPVEMQLKPINYRGGTIGDSRFRLACADFPMCSWSQDAYSAWWALNSNSYQISNQRAGLQIGGSALAGLVGAGAAAALATNPIGMIGAGLAGALGLFNAGTSALDKVLSNQQTKAQAEDSASLASGTFAAGNVNYTSGGNRFVGERMSITGNMARRIDNFFTMYGYNIGQPDNPTRKRRQRFTYIKTVNANIYGELPSDDAQAIAAMYDRGIRFWYDTVHFLDYSIANPPL